MELIDRQAFLKNKVWNCGGSMYDPYCNGYSDALDRVQEVLEAAPTVDAVEVVHGEWALGLDEYDCEYIECSVCGGCFYDGDNDTFDKPYLYCPNCGAKMDGGAEDG